MTVDTGHVYRDTVNGHELRVLEVIGGEDRCGVYARCETENGFPVFVETEALLGPRYRLIMVPAKIDGEVGS